MKVDNDPAFSAEEYVPQNASSRQATLRTLRILHGTFIVSIFLYLYVMRIVSPANAESLNPVLPWVLGAIAASNLAVGQRMRSKQLRIAFDTLRAQPEDADALARWRRGVIIGDCLAMAVVLYGLVIFFLGGTTLQVAPFLLAGATAMLFWWPREPEL
jgi:hypothetical protein